MDLLKYSRWFTASLIVIAAMSLPIAQSHAQDSFLSWLEELRMEALGNGINEEAINKALKDIELLPRVIELDRKQPEFTLTYQEYLARVVTKLRVERAHVLLSSNSKILHAVAEIYGVQPRFLVALWGIESDFGRLTGGFNVIPALATLAFDGRRSSYFRKELINALRIIDQGHIEPEHMTGSWAGAMGQAQFMPSTYLNFAVDKDGDGINNIWTSKPDVFASAANYLARSGWRDDITWGRQVQIPTGFDQTQFGLKILKTLPEWQALGVRRADGTALPTRPLHASLIAVEKGMGPSFLVYENFRVLLKWNRSTFFALSVGHLADQLRDQ